MARTIDIPNSFVLNRRLFNASHTEPVAFVDRGADSCIGGIGWTPIAYTGHKANLVGYDDRHTKKSGLDICTLATKVRPNSDEAPILLVAHEMIYNPGSSTSLISEYQVREHGCVVDSISHKHRCSTKGEWEHRHFTQQMTVPLS